LEIGVQQVGNLRYEPAVTLRIVVHPTVRSKHAESLENSEGLRLVEDDSRAPAFSNTLLE
jgi:hypothetical protein